MQRRPSRPCGPGAPAGPGATSAGSRSVTISGWRARTSRAGPQRARAATTAAAVASARADDGGAAAARPAGPVGEGAHGLGGGADGHQVGAGVAERLQPCRRRTSPTSRRRAATGRARRPGPGRRRRRWRPGRGRARRGRRRGRWARGPGRGRRQHVRRLTVGPASPHVDAQLARTLFAGRAPRRPVTSGPAGGAVRGRGASASRSSSADATRGSPEATPSASICSASFMASSIRVSTIFDSGHGLDDLALDEDLALAVARGDPEVGLARLAGTVDHAAHHRDPQRHLHALQTRP